MSKPTLFAIYADGCPACEMFKKFARDTFIKEITKRNKVILIEVTLENIGTKLPDSFPSDLQKFVRWYPTFVLVNTDTLTSSKINGVVFNGELKNGEYALKEKNLLRPTADNIINWVEWEITNNPNITNEKLVPKKVILDNEFKTQEKVVIMENGKPLPKDSKYYSYDFI